MDASKLTPGPLTASRSLTAGWFDLRGQDDLVGIYLRQDDAEFHALASAAFDVMIRRGWWPVPAEAGKWIAASDAGDFRPIRADDPFTALVEADRWYRENVERLTTE